MVQSGQALAYRKYLALCDGGPFLNAEAQAKQSRLGVWAVSGGSNAHGIGTMGPEEPYL
jgi:endonuclease YncB( thermonuclease family)